MAAVLRIFRNSDGGCRSCFRIQSWRPVLLRAQSPKLLARAIRISMEKPDTQRIANFKVITFNPEDGPPFGPPRTNAPCLGDHHRPRVARPHPETRTPPPSSFHCCFTSSDRAEFTSRDPPPDCPRPAVRSEAIDQQIWIVLSYAPIQFPPIQNADPISADVSAGCPIPT